MSYSPQDTSPIQYSYYNTVNSNGIYTAVNNKIPLDNPTIVNGVTTQTLRINKGEFPYAVANASTDTKYLTGGSTYTITYSTNTILTLDSSVMTFGESCLMTMGSYCPPPFVKWTDGFGISRTKQLNPTAQSIYCLYIFKGQLGITIIGF